jgi:NTE family protein
MKNETIPNKQRALVLQGGGALGAYEAGAFKALCEKIGKKDEKGRPLFDIIAGTSIGAINAAIIVSEFLKEKNWKSSAEKLENFWKHVSVPSDIVLERTPWWHNKNRQSASREAARRYYCTKKFTYTGVKNVFTSPTMINDGKFFDMGDTVHDWLPSWITLPNVVKNIWIRYNNEPLKRSLHEFSNFPISTSFDNSEPRLLLVSVDVAEGIAVTFDS